MNGLQETTAISKWLYLTIGSSLEYAATCAATLAPTRTHIPSSSSSSSSLSSLLQHKHDGNPGCFYRPRDSDELQAYSSTGSRDSPSIMIGWGHESVNETTAAFVIRLTEQKVHYCLFMGPADRDVELGDCLVLEFTKSFSPPKMLADEEQSKIMKKEYTKLKEQEKEVRGRS